MEGLAAEHPDAVDDVIGEDLDAELEHAPERFGGRALRRAADAGRTMTILLAPRVRRWLDEAALPPVLDEPWRGRMVAAADVLLRTDDPADRERVAGMARRALEGGLERLDAGMWLGLLFRTDPGAAVDGFEAGMARLPVKRQGRAVQLVAPLAWERLGGPLVDLRSLSADQLRRLVGVAYAHVQPTDDALREGHHTPDVRDNAQHSRNALLSALLATPGEEGWRAKHALVADPGFANMRDYIARAALRNAAREADEPCSPEDAVALDRHGETPPRTTRAMFELMLDRLEEVGDRLAADDTPREAWAALTLEHHMRRAIACILRDRAAGLYDVNQEAVTGDEKETDIRLTVAGGQQGVIELKLGRRYSVAQLRQALHGQLIGRYLIPSNRRAGVLVITLASDRTWLVDRRRIGFTELIALLDREAAEAVRAHPLALHVAVWGVDLRQGPRLRLIG